MSALQLPNGAELPEQDLVVRYVRSSGPGGQNVNKVSTKTELRFQLEQTHSLTLARKRRLRETFPSHVTLGGEFVVTSDRFRSQSMNHADALRRLVAMIHSVWTPPPPRVPTKVSKRAKKRRVADKRARGEQKRGRTNRED
jgi:ribosome-associated protein